MAIKIPKKHIPLIVAAVFGLIAVYLINMYIQQQTEMAQQRVVATQRMLTTVVVARRDIPAGTTLEESMLREEGARKDLLQPGAVTTMDRVIGRITLAPIAKGEQILLNKVAISGQEISLSAKIPRDKRAITIPVDNISSVGGMIRPGDHVDILGIVPMPVMTPEGKQVSQMVNLPLFQDVLVLAVGQEYTAIPGMERGEKRLSPIITLALAPEEANLVAFVQEQGKIRLVLRSPEDTKKQPVVPAGWDTVLRTVMPDMFKAKPQEQVPAGGRTVEIIRGTTKEEKVLEEE